MLSLQVKTLHNILYDKAHYLHNQRRRLYTEWTVSIRGLQEALNDSSMQRTIHFVPMSLVRFMCWGKITENLCLEDIELN
jgi:hypothetical protein